MKTNLYRVVIIVLGLVSLMSKSGCYHLTKKQEWNTIAMFDFDKGGIWNISLEETDPGLIWSIVDDAGRFSGITQDTEWIGNRIWLPVTGDKCTTIEISGDFKINQSSGHQLVGLWGLTDNNKIGWSPLCMYFEGKNGTGCYYIQTRWLKLKSKRIQKRKTKRGIVFLQGETAKAVKHEFSNPQKGFHTMKMVLNRESSEISYYIDDISLGVVKVEGEIGPITKVMMDIETPVSGVELDIRYDNLRVRSSGDIY
ncbi:MAG: hypothetical protein KAS46_05975 [Candidatus Aureabacteria bacterium]|nr:hypothetical protein [Candidatus Auribacterota bacterium]